jgi:hypothetical protein
MTQRQRGGSGEVRRIGRTPTTGKSIGTAGGERTTGGGSGGRKYGKKGGKGGGGSGTSSGGPGSSGSGASDGETT